MDEKRAREIIIEMNPRGEWIKLPPSGDSISMDGHFSADELEAISWWLKNKPRDKCTPELDGQILCALGDNCPVNCGAKFTCDTYNRIHWRD